jgi:GH43 family beta-xylosidase
MTEAAAALSAATYLNPVYPHSFPDPFVLKFCGEYFAYCTDFWHDGQVFGVLRSRNLVDWTPVGGAMRKLERDTPFYWAPEVTYANGKFYLYYSVGNETLMELRVAVSDRPDGGFVDSGRRLTREDFAIDAHVFVDDTGQKYLFYATDFLTHSHVGTGTVVDKMVDFFTLEGHPRPVTRARYDWQVYDPQRWEKGGVRWHTIEGSFVLKRKGVYYQMFSGGNWQNISYGVSFAVTDDLEKPEEWTQFSDGERILPILRTVPGLVVGPGHNCVVRGTNNRELYCVYHRWTDHQRTLSIDRQDFAGPRIFIEGASFAPQLAPFAPAFADFFDGGDRNANWLPVGEWKISGGAIFSEPAARSELLCRHQAERFLCEFSLRAASVPDEKGRYGFCLCDHGEQTFEFLISPASLTAAVSWLENGRVEKRKFALPAGFDCGAFHLLRVEADGSSVKIALDEAVLKFERLIEEISNQIAFVGEDMAAGFSGFALTEGFEDLFDWPEAELARRGWKKLTAEGTCRVEDQRLVFSNPAEKNAALLKGEAAANFEFAANLRLVEPPAAGSAFGFALLSTAGAELARLSIVETGGIFHLTDERNSFAFALPQNFRIAEFHQFRLLKFGETLLLQLEGIDLGEIPVSGEAIKIALFCRRATIALDMVRLTVL